MSYNVRQTRTLSDEELLSKLHIGAVIYSEYADKDMIFIFLGNGSEKYDMYEVHFGSNNFMHLAGIKSITYKAKDFYKACLDKTLCIEDCSPRHSRNNMYEKVSVLPEILQLRHAKCYKIGEKNLITKDNDFEMVTGNHIGVLGYDSRISIQASKQVDKQKKPIPTTLLVNSITSYCKNPQKILFILTKQKEIYYQNLFFEIKRGLLQDLIHKMPEKIKSKIHIVE